MVLRKVKGILKKGAYAGLAAVILATSVQPAAVFAQDSAEPEETVETVVETEQTVSGNETDVETEESTLESTPEDTGEETAEEAGGTEEETETEAEILPGKTEGVKETEAVSAFSERAAEERTVTVTTLFYNSDGSLSTEFGGTSTYTRKDGTSWNVSTAIFKKGWILGPVTVEGMEDTNPADYKVEGVIDGSDVNITFVWYEDQTGPDGTSDKIPDQCQIEVTFAVENGTWNDGTSEPVTRFLTLTDAEGNPSVDGSAVAGVPEAGGKPDSGYIAGSWSPSLKANYTKEDDGAVYVYSYRVPQDRKITVTTLFYNSDGSLSTEKGGTSTYTRKDGTGWNVSTAIYNRGWILGPVTVEGMEDTNPADYKVEGVIDGSDVNITFVWYEDQTGPDGTSDKIPDQCQIEVTFAVENGTWNDGTSEPVTRFLTLTDAEGNPSVDGSAVAAVPEAGQFPAEGYTEGSWNPALKAAYTKADEGLTYVYSYAEIQPENPDTEKPNQDKTDTDAEKTSASGKTSETRQNQNTDTVRTGDSANAVLWGTMAAVAGAVLAGAAAGKYRKIKK